MTDQIGGLENERPNILQNCMHLRKYYFIQQQSHTTLRVYTGVHCPWLMIWLGLQNTTIVAFSPKRDCVMKFH